MLRTHLFSALPDGDQVPDWVHLLPAGTFSGGDGRGPFTLAEPEAVIAASMEGGKLALDENHSVDLAAPKGEPSPARGWIVELQSRADGIWARVEWTAAGRALMADKAYRGISPVIEAEVATGRIARVKRASLVNDPNLKLTTLHNRSPHHMDLLTKARAALGLAADATEDAVIAALGANKTQLDAHAAAAKTIATAAGLAETTAPGEIATRVELHYRGASTSEAELRQHVTSLQAQLSTLEATGKKAAAEAYVDGAIKDGKPVKPLRDHYVTRHMADPAAVEKEIGALASIHGGGITAPPVADPKTGLTAEQNNVCSLMGLDPAKYAETLQATKQEAL